MVVLGGYVRLNKAGLSMVKWDLTRLAAPKTSEEWDKEFKEYKEHPQYKNDFPNLSMEGFKIIYLLEHYHRQLGKVLGILIIAPTLVFSMLKILNKKMRIRCLLISSIIVVQGIIGMWMVRSGLRENLGENHEKNNVRVSHYRLATHFTFAITTYWLLLNSALFLLLKPQILKNDFNFLYSNNVIRKNLVLTIHLVLITAIFGSLLAGQDAGKIVNTFPKMGDRWIPSKEHYKYETNLLRINLENDFLVHFNHRTLATITLSAIICNFLLI
jgi:cytochrome c oxidase assembly protein subunit 15